MTTQTHVLITGAGRGIGKAFIAKYLARPDHTVVATLRDTSKASTFDSLPRGKGSSLIVVKIDGLSDTDPTTAVSELKDKHAIERLDIVIANAGMCDALPMIHEIKSPELSKHLQVNLFSVILLFQATRPLLLKSNAPKFVTITSDAGSLKWMYKVPIPNGYYGSSKAALNWVTLKIHVENPSIIAMPLHPGWVATDLGIDGAALAGVGPPTLTAEESVDGLVSLIDTASKEASSGKYVRYDGVAWEW